MDFSDEDGIDPREETEEGSDPLEAEGGEPGESDAEREAREDREEAEHEARHGRAPAGAEHAQQPAAAPHPAEASPFWSVLPAAYQNAVRSGVLSVEQALSRHQANQAQHINRIHRQLEQTRAELAAGRQADGSVAARNAERLERLAKALGVEEPSPGRLPSPEEDLGGHLVGRLAQIEQRLEAGQLSQQQAEAERRETVELARESDGVWNHSAATYHAAVAEIPDYEDAEAFVAERVFAAEALRLSEQFPGATEAQINQQAAANVMKMSADLQIHAARNGRSLPHDVYAAARSMGYGQQAAAAMAAQPPAAPTRQSRDQARMAAARANRNGAQTIAGTPPRVSPPSDQQMIAAILDFTDEEFDELFDGLDNQQAEKQFRDLLRPYAH